MMVAQDFPDSAGIRIAQVEQLRGALGPWTGLGKAHEVHWLLWETVAPSNPVKQLRGTA